MSWINLTNEHHEIPIRLETQTDWNTFISLARTAPFTIYIADRKHGIMVDVNSDLGLASLKDCRHLYYVSEREMPFALTRYIQETDYDFDN